MAPEEATVMLSHLNAKLTPKIQPPFLMHVGGTQWYKNRLGLLAIFNYLKRLTGMEEIQLIMAGKPLSDTMGQFIRTHNLEKWVIEVSAPSNDELRALYSTATALIFPSFHEGFGVPPIEAQACGCPVFASNRLPMTEVGGEAAVYFDPEDHESAAKIIADTLLNPKKMEQMKQKGFVNAARFPFQRMMQSYCELFQKIA